MINVSKPYLPPLEEYSHYLEGIWNRGWLTNHGPLVTELENQLKQYLGVKYVQVVSSGTMALHIAVKSLNLTGEVITTAFSHVAGVNALLWRDCQPVFVDIEAETFCLAPEAIEEAITDKTCAIMATHVYGYPCDVESIQAIAQRHGLKVIYDGAHAFGAKVNNQSVFNYGDISAVSFHATKLYHMIEGGAIFTNDEQIAQKCLLHRNFGLKDMEPHYAGTNGKNSEFHAAMGLCNLPRVIDFISKGREIALRYHSLLSHLPLQFPAPSPAVEHNYSYFPVVFSSPEKMLAVQRALADAGINARRYFHPSLNKLPYYGGAACPIAEDISGRVLCLPFYYELSLADAERIAQRIVQQY